jgi:hypothetical protein
MALWRPAVREDGILHSCAKHGNLVAMRFETEACDLGLSRQSGRCAIDTSQDRPIRELTPRQRLARLAAAAVFGLVARLFAPYRAAAPLVWLAAWFGVSHVAAAATSYGGCPELGAVPSLVLRRRIVTECGPWDWIDGKISAGQRREGAPTHGPELPTG